MRRREFIRLLASTAVAWPSAAGAQQAGKIPTIGLLSAGSDEGGTGVIRKFLLPALQESGWIEGKNLVIERRFAENRIVLVSQKTCV
jgi:putative tryptophan/tyrosine transport system substrate-binding protein